ncbi:MAG TPA: GIY-YIG nuclease family protein [Vulgatibacter sp.]|nr:GIY-YIG nuclease family protein [Vulgatibacter sp.]
MSEPSAATGLPPRGAWCVYLLRCADGSLYAGATNDLAARLARHGAGKGAAYTRARLPVSLAWWEAAADRGAALRREAAIKRLPRPAKLALASGAKALRRDLDPPIRR